MPVTKTAKRALRSSKKKSLINKLFLARLEIAMRKAKKLKIEKAIQEAISLVDKAAKKKIIHKNKAARMKGSLSRLPSKATPKKQNKIKQNKTKTRKGTSSKSS